MLSNVIHRKPKIMLFALRELHLPVLLPVYRELQKMDFAQIGFVAPPFTDREDLPQEGLKAETIAKLQSQNIAYWGSNENGEIFDCIVTADACPDRIEGWGPFVCVGHGTISKNIYFINTHNSRREAFSTVLCVPGPWYVGAFEGTVHTRIEPTGFPKMDEYALEYSEQKQSLFAQIGFSFSKKTILFAPTFNPELNGLAILVEEWNKMDPQKYQILVKLHGATEPSLREQYRKLCSLFPHMHFVDDPSVVPYMKMADIVISDISSAFVEAFVLDVPVIVVNNPGMYKSGMYNPKAVEFLVRDAAYQIEKGSELHKVLKQLTTEDPLKEKRREYCQMLFPKLDGKNSWRAAQVIRQVAQGKIRKQPQRPMHIVLPDAPVNTQALITNLKRAIFPLTLYATKPDQYGFLHSELGTTPLQIQPLHAQNMPQAPWICLTGEHIFPYNWDELYDHLIRSQGSSNVYGACFGEGSANPNQDFTLMTKKRFLNTPVIIQSYAKMFHFFESVPAQWIIADGFCASTNVPWPIIQRLIQATRPNQMQTIAQELSQLGVPIRMCPGIFGI